MTLPRLRKALGIDLGTTNSVVSLLDPSGRRLRTGLDDEGRAILPSLIAWDEGKGALVSGHDARAVPDRLPLSSVKRFMGLERRFVLGPRSLAAPDVSAVILRRLREMMARALGAEAERHLLDLAVITMPAYFNHGQIEATRRAGELAGFEVAELLHEPTAAAIYYSWLHRHRDATYLVYDLGGGTFDVSVIRRRLGDHEVLAVSGDPFLGGDDFDRSLASWMVERGEWRLGDAGFDPHALLVPGDAPFAALVRAAETVKMELTDRERVERTITLPPLDGKSVTCRVSVSLDDFRKLIRDRVGRTIDCCHEALGRARERAGLRLGDIDHIVLVGGSTRVPLVKEVVREAFANPDLPERVKSPELLCHEPDLAVAYGAALRAAGHGVRHLFPVGKGSVELHVTSPPTSDSARYEAAGVVRLNNLPTASLEGGSVRIRSAFTGLIDEAYLDPNGGFEQEVEIHPEAETALEWTVCDADGQPLAATRTEVSASRTGPMLGQGVLATQLITRPLAIEVLTRSRQRVTQVLAPIGAALPATFRCVCRTADQSGRVVVPILEDHRVISQLVIEGLDRSLPVGSPVEVAFAIDARHVIEASVRVRNTEHEATATIEPPPPPDKPTREEIAFVMGELEDSLEGLSGRHRTRLRARANALHAELMEALGYDDEARAIQRMSELKGLVAQAERIKSAALEPPWTRFAGLVRHAMDLAADVADKSSRDREELFGHIRAQERYAEQAHDEANQALYKECWDNLSRYAAYLEQLLHDALPRPNVPPRKRDPEREAREEVDRFKQMLSNVWKQAREKKRADLDFFMGEIARQASGLSAKLKDDPVAAMKDARRLVVEIEKIRDKMAEPKQAPPDAEGGLLEGSG
ncbi:MAG: Hsp70 family protein [Gemmataceae bacterium]|nr:Hsp70 family protein [Gemmataceae bacterium]